MEKENNPIYERNTLEFVTVALEFCTFVETAGQNGLFDFIDKGIKLLPLLYLKATLLPEAEVDDEKTLTWRHFIRICNIATRQSLHLFRKT